MLQVSNPAKGLDIEKRQEIKMSQNQKKIGRETAIRQGKPIELLNLIFYPIKMSHYEQFLDAKNALTLRLGSLPVKYQAKDFINAIWSLEIDSVRQSQKKVGILERVFRFLSMSLRIDFDVKQIFDWITLTQNSNGDTAIEAIKVTQDGKVVSISPIDFSAQIRPLIAKQNGLELPDEEANIELVNAEKELQELKAKGCRNLNINTSDLIASVAYNSHVSEREIDDWTIREFENRYKAIDRDKKYKLYGQAELSGMVSFKNGNPYLSWAYDTIDDTMGTLSMQALGEQLGGVTAKN
uniref:Uncharacterized protein n=1 Tax=Siphoviridae sp. ctnMR5 TaxID=2825658 RepID=A0A8S5U916_9CAUD|nr:MAG TPA: hypothetical protein [Siphoviridae sp. ctnMR5]